MLADAPGKLRKAVAARRFALDLPVISFTRPLRAEGAGLSLCDRS
jgi:hypothetical protein